MEHEPFHKVELGDPLSRVDGVVKVTGKAKYAVEYDITGVTHGVLVTSTIAKGRIKSINTKDAEKAPGVLTIITHLNSPKVHGYDTQGDNPGAAVKGHEFRLFYNDLIYYNHQPVALAVADTLERANYAASLVKVEYDTEKHITDIDGNIDNAFKPEKGNDYSRGVVDMYKQAAIKIEQEYKTPIQVHNPMEPHGATAMWESENKVIVYNKTQAVKNLQRAIMRAFNLKEENVKVNSPFVGGAFGSASRLWPHEMAALLGAKKTGRPVKVAAKREQVFNMVGYRPLSRHKVGLGATSDGILTGVTHEAFGSTSTYEQFIERIVDPTKTLYGCPNLNTVHKLVALDMSTPTWTRGPGETSGSFALESAIDELAHAVKIDPITFRLKNFAETDPQNNKPWSSNHLKECYEQGAKRFGWSKRNPVPRSMTKNGLLVGMGMSAGIYKSERLNASASVTLMENGNVIVRCSVADVGPGSATIMTQIAAETLEIDVTQVRFEWGNSSFPEAPGQSGSQTTASTGSAVYEVCTALKQRLQELAVGIPGTAFEKVQPADLIAKDGSVMLVTQPNVKISFSEILKQHSLPELEVTKESKGGSERDRFSTKSFCATFVEVHVHPTTGVVRVKKVVSAIDAGKIINHKTAQSQVYGAVTWGIGLALMEEGIVDHRYGRYVNNNLADYHVPVNADIPDIDVILIDKRDPIINAMGAKGIGEVPLVGFTAAVANAVFHATGKRIRELPITADKLVEEEKAVS